ncbi:transposase [Paracoccus pantotrophus]|uniref:Transposase n=1 Tax=Paracoccus pantotrophus TaxID=82367 RepID=A0AAE6TS73_PARPN|nr:transposase [Paracoccus pantotrophus]
MYFAGMACGWCEHLQVAMNSRPPVRTISAPPGRAWAAPGHGRMQKAQRHGDMGPGGSFRPLASTRAHAGGPTGSTGPLLPGKAGARGRSGADDRPFTDAILWLARGASPWRDPPPAPGHWQAVRTWFRRWTAPRHGNGFSRHWAPVPLPNGC